MCQYVHEEIDSLILNVHAFLATCWSIYSKTYNFYTTMFPGQWCPCVDSTGAHAVIYVIHTCAVLGVSLHVCHVCARGCVSPRPSSFRVSLQRLVSSATHALRSIHLRRSSPCYALGVTNWRIWRAFRSSE